MRPELSKETPANQFREYYWLKSELQLFCRSIGMSASGSKEEISTRIGHFLETGIMLKPSRTARPKAVQPVTLSLDTIIPEGHRCSQHVRTFFQSVIPNFHFSTFIQNYFRENIGKTYRDAVQAWHEEEKRKKDPSYERVISPQFEYNRFIRDYFNDPHNTGHSRNDAIAAWNEVKSKPGSNRYSRDL